MKPLISSLIALALTLPANALTPKSAAYLKTLGFDPASEDVRLADKSGKVETTNLGEPVTFSLESLAAGKKKNQIKPFITTRAFVERLKIDFAGTIMPKKDYEATYVAQQERSLVGDKVVAILRAGSSSQEASPTPKVPPASTDSMPTETAQFLRAVSVDPESKEIVLIYSEGPVETTYQGDPQVHSLDTLAAQKAKNGIKSFIVTRNFIRRLKKDFAGTPIPAEGYDGGYLTLEERKLALKKVFPD